MPRRRTADEIQAQIDQLTIQRNAAREAEKSAKIKAQAKKRGQMLALIGLATIACIQATPEEEKNRTLDFLFSAFLERYPIETDGLTEAQKEKRQKDSDLLREALKLARKGQLK